MKTILIPGSNGKSVKCRLQPVNVSPDGNTLKLQIVEPGRESESQYIDRQSYELLKVLNLKL